MRVGEKGQVVIPKELRETTGIREGTEVIVEAKGETVTIRRAGPAIDDYGEYFAATISKKLTHQVNIKKLIEEEYHERQQSVS